MSSSCLALSQTWSSSSARPLLAINPESKAFYERGWFRRRGAVARGLGVQGSQRNSGRSGGGFPGDTTGIAHASCRKAPVARKNEPPSCSPPRRRGQVTHVVVEQGLVEHQSAGMNPANRPSPADLFMTASARPPRHGGRLDATGRPLQNIGSFELLPRRFCSSSYFKHIVDSPI